MQQQMHLQAEPAATGAKTELDYYSVDYCSNKVMELIQTDKTRLVVGLGLTGRSTMRFLQRRGLPFIAVDTRDSLPDLPALREEFPGVQIHLGKPLLDCCAHADEIYLSPGLAPETAGVRELCEAGARLSGDLDLFMAYVDAPVLAITGSNAKSTVTELVGAMLAKAGVAAGVGGNLGTPMLDLLDEERDCYVLELSSFQLERAAPADFAVACLLNVSPDHMDRHKTLMQYHQLKQSVFAAARVAVYNREDPLTQPLQRQGMPTRSFGWHTSGLQDFCMLERDGKARISMGVTPLLAADELPLAGRHNLLNVMAALAVVDAAGVSLEPAIAAAKAFTGLAHRCELVAIRNGVRYINDSKATNVGACIAALAGFAKDANKLVLIAGGQTKGADFSALAKIIASTQCELVLIGEGASEIAAACKVAATGREVAIEFADDMPDAVRRASARASNGDIVLLSPACASFDMFSGFAARGEAFIQAVNALDRGGER
ncbi:MAG: UDP-N-acetylmuramoyl-L-alanine--D-glutamate ligase [Pseudomonadales bacterium]